MPLPFEADAPTDPAPPLYRYFDTVEALRIYWRSPGAGANAGNVFLDWVTITVEGDGIDLPPVLPEYYMTWAAEWFGDAINDIDLRDSLWGPDANPSGDGLSNRLKAGLGISPLETFAGQIPAIHVLDADHVVLRFPLNPQIGAANWRVEMSPEPTFVQPVVVPTDSAVALDSGDWLWMELPVGDYIEPSGTFFRLVIVD